MEKLPAITRRYGTTSAVVHYAAFSLLCRALTGHEAAIFLTPVSLRTPTLPAGVLGPLTEFMPFAYEAKAHFTTKDLMEATSRHLGFLLAHAWTPLSVLARSYAPGQENEPLPFSSVGFTTVEGNADVPHDGGLNVASWPIPRRYGLFETYFAVANLSGNGSVLIDYHTGALSDDDAELLYHGYMHALNFLCAEDRTVNEFSLSHTMESRS